MGANSQQTSSTMQTVKDRPSTMIGGESALPIAVISSSDQAATGKPICTKFSARSQILVKRSQAQCCFRQVRDRGGNYSGKLVHITLTGACSGAVETRSPHNWETRVRSQT